MKPRIKTSALKATALLVALGGFASPAVAGSAICKSVDQNGVPHYHQCPGADAQNQGTAKSPQSSKAQTSRKVNTDSRYGGAVTHAGPAHRVSETPATLKSKPEAQ